MQLLYTGAIAPNQPSTMEKSLGGFCSDTLVPNGSTSNLFSTITRTLVKKNQREVKMVVLKNTLTVSVSDLKIYTNTPTNALEQLRIAAILPAYDSKCNRYYFEQIGDSSQLPYQSVLAFHEGELNAIEVDDIVAPGTLVGIWVERTYKDETINKYNPPPGTDCCSDEQVQVLEELAQSLPTDSVQLIIDFEIITPTTTTTTVEETTTTTTV